MVEFSHFMGQDGFHWFVGVVEDRIDPSALGRVRVRCLGYHSSDVVQLPTTELPWAHVMHPVTDPCMQGMGIHSFPTVRDSIRPIQPLAAIYSYVTRHNVTDTYVHYYQSVVSGWREHISSVLCAGGSIPAASVTN